MKKSTSIIGIFLLTLSIFSCKKNCEHCHKIKIYDDAKVGTFEIIEVVEACGYWEKKSYSKKDVHGTDAKGPYKTFWVCGLYESDYKK